MKLSHLPALTAAVSILSTTAAFAGDRGPRGQQPGATRDHGLQTANGLQTADGLTLSAPLNGAGAGATATRLTDDAWRALFPLKQKAN